MSYKCENCGKRFAGNDGELLSKFPAHVRASYPVEPRFASGAWHFHQDATDELQSLMRTYASGDFFCRVLHQRSGKQFERQVETFLSRSPSRGGKDWQISHQDWMKKFIPSGESIRDYFLKGEKSSLTSCGVANNDCYERELQGVGANGVVAVAIDWTFQVIKNFDLPGAKACFTIKIDTGETAGLAIVNSTAASQVSHFLQQMVVKRSSFCPKHTHGLIP